uniref:Uncharacterized protein n=1 Tax=Bacteriophage sp. TaxID=38018 RepID=A0A8D9PEH0_9VIRU|nr:MAG TPA: hypothetical protein [Bacteriophage sp.]
MIEANKDVGPYSLQRRDRGISLLLLCLSSLTTCSGREVSSDNRHLPEPILLHYHQ